MTAAEEQGQNEWGPEHDKELESVRSQKRGMLADALLREELPLGFVSDQVISDAQILQRKQREADQRQEQNLSRVAKGKKRPEVEMQGQTACIDEHGLSAGLEMDALLECVVLNNMTLADPVSIESLNASFLVVQSLNCHWSITLIASLAGSMVCNHLFFLSQGLEGAAAGFKRATSTRRKLWLTQSFIDEEPLMSELVLSAMAKPDSNWRLMSDENEFIVKVAAGQKGFAFIGLVSSRTKQDCATSTAADIFCI